MVSQAGKRNPLNQRFEDLVFDTLERWHVPGVSVAVSNGDKTWAKGYGVASLPSTPVEPSTLFYAGSTTKAFTAAIMSFLVDDNDKYPHIQWDTPICELIRDDFVLENEYMTTHITIEDALSHRSGLPGHDESLGGPGTSLKTIVRNLRYMPATAELRTKYQYNNSMFATVSYVIETVTGRRLGDLMREWIWEPLGMQSTFFDLDSAKSTKEHLAHGYQYLYHTDEGGFEVVDWMTLDEVSGAGAVITNVLDYSKWARAIFTKSTPLSNKAFQEWLRPRTIMPEEPPFTGPRMYALGWRTGVYHGQQFYAHSGGVSGFGAELYIFPGIDFAVVSLANTGGTSNFVGNRLTFDLIDERLEVPSDSRFDWNKRNQNIISKGQDKSKNAIEVLYPQLPLHRTPPSLPIESYTGTYRHPGYGGLPISLRAPHEGAGCSSVAGPSTTLYGDRTHQTWPQVLVFEHVNGDFFVARSKSVTDFGALYDDVYAIEFRVNSEGKVDQVGIAWEAAMGSGKIWLRKAVNNEERV